MHNRMCNIGQESDPGVFSTGNDENRDKTRVTRSHDFSYELNMHGPPVGHITTMANLIRSGIELK